MSKATAGQPSGSSWGSPQGRREKHPEDPSASLQDCCWHGESSRLADGVPMRPRAGTTVSAHVLGEETTQAGRVPILSGGLMHTHGGREGERAWRALRWQSQQGGAQWDPRRAPALGPAASPLLWPPPSDRGLGDTWEVAEPGWDLGWLLSSLCTHTPWEPPRVPCACSLHTGPPAARYCLESSLPLPPERNASAQGEVTGR